MIRDPSDHYGYMDMARRANEEFKQRTGRRVTEYLQHSVEREVIPSRVDSLDVKLALWTCEAMVAEEAG